MPTELLTPVGRLVQGSPFEPRTTDAEGNPLTIRNGANAGKPRVDYFMALAIPKNDPGWNDINTKIYNEAKSGFPNLFDAAGNCIHPQFAWKIIDGDSQVPNSRNVKPCDREGYPGNWVLMFSSGIAPKVYTAGGEALLTNPAELKRGDYIRIYGNVAGNESQQRPGVYLNHSLVERVGFGEEIITGVTGEQAFGGQPAALPPGASATPTAPATPMQNPNATAPAPGSQPGAPAPAHQPAAPAAAPATPAPTAPATDFLNPTGAPAPGAEPKFQTPDGRQFTEAELIAAGWNQQQVYALPRV